MDAVGRILEQYANMNYKWGCIIGILCFAVYLFIKRKTKTWRTLIEAVCFSLYIVIVFGGTILNRRVGKEYGVELLPLWSYYETFVKGVIYLKEQMLYNVLVFVPWGMLFPFMFQKMKTIKRVLISAGVFSFAIELSQLIFRCGTCEFDDMIHNVLGAAIGYGIWKLICRVRGEICTKKSI